jgi:hypothetical protein
MKLVIGALAVLAISATPVMAQSSNSVGGYFKRDGTYVAPHYRTNPNQTRNDNWSTAPNVNPYTGRVGTRSGDYGYTPQPVYRAPSYGSSYGGGINPRSSYGAPQKKSGGYLF